MREETYCRNFMGNSFCPFFRLAGTDLLYAPSNRKDSTYHGICYTSCGTLVGTRNSPIGLREREKIKNRFIKKLRTREDDDADGDVGRTTTLHISSWDTGGFEIKLLH